MDDVSSGSESEEAASGADDVQPVLSIGDTIDGRYRVVGRLGRGGMGEVVEVEHLKLGRTFALKALRRDLFSRRKVVQRFRTEWAAMAAIRSEHVVTIVDTGSLESGVPYFVMERLVGQDLRALLSKARRLPPARVAELGIDACYGLRALHSAGLVHRDLKPENLFVTGGDDGRDVVKLLDLGVAKIVGDNATAPGAVIGTARYMAPEQVGDAGAVGPAADIFALGVILYEALAGRAPFSGDTLERLLFKIMSATPEPLATLCPEAPPALVESVERAMAKAPADRHASAAAFAESLVQAVGSSRARAGEASLVSGGPWGGTTVDESRVSRDERSTATPPGAVAPSRAGRAAINRRWLGLAAAASVAVVLALMMRRGDQPAPEEAAMATDAATALAPAPVAPPRAEPAPPVTPPEAAVASVTAPLPVASSPKRAPSSPSTAARRSVPAGSGMPAAPRIAFDPENPYGQ